ncbi:MAG TPA: hypothetical protein VIK55_19260 [Paludibacter sp.]
MKKIIYGQSKFLFIIQWITLFFVLLFVSIVIFTFIPFQNIEIKDLIIWLLIVLFMFSVFYYGVFSRNIVIKTEKDIEIHNFLRKKPINLSEIKEVKIIWLFPHCELKLFNGKHYNFNLDSEDFLDVFYHNNQEIKLKYNKRLEETK